tara:strand:- start:1471 stop:1638 length:168 start_codon:yes stop_codon:yes gene_type:complete
MIKQIALKIDKLELDRVKKQNVADFAMGTRADMLKFKPIKKTYFLVVPTNDASSL